MVRHGFPWPRGLDLSIPRRRPPIALALYLRTGVPEAGCVSHTRVPAGSPGDLPALSQPPLSGASKVNCFYSVLPEELWTEVHNIVQEAVIKTIPKKKKGKKGKMIV